MIRSVSPDPHVIEARRRFPSVANLQLAARIEREWHNLPKLEHELASRDELGEHCR